jgi:antagonist of KipI
MGYRLAGEPLRLSASREYLSEAVSPGTVQVTPEGQPIVLLADAPPTGGYPKIAQVVQADLPVLAQCKPGDVLRFEEVTIGEARQLLLERERQIRLIREGIRLHGNVSPRT